MNVFGILLVCYAALHCVFARGRTRRFLKEAGGDGAEKNSALDLLWLVPLVTLLPVFFGWGGQIKNVGNASRCGRAVVLLDVSDSMKAEDQDGGSRLAASEKLLSVLSEHCAGRGGSVGLVTYGALASWRIEPTEDWSAFNYFMRDRRMRFWREAPGSDLANALRALSELYAKINPSKLAGQNRPERPEGLDLIIVISDGGFADGAEALAELRREVFKLGIPIVSVGVGGRVSVPIPVYDDEGKFKENKKLGGEVALTSLNESPLRIIATSSGGRYFHAGAPGVVDKIGEIMEKIESEEENDGAGGKDETVGSVRFYDGWFLLLSLFAIAVVTYFAGAR